MWESSRFILPELRERMLEYQRIESLKRKKPILDEEALTEIDRKLRESLRTGRIVGITEFGEIEDQEYSGVVKKIDTYSQKIKLEVSDGLLLLDFGGVTAVY